MNKTELKHPDSLKIFFFTEMWERYGFYVVQSLLALYLAFHFKWDDTHVYALVGSFTALTYLTPFIGGWIADKWLGQKKSVLAGAVVLFFSYLALLFSNNHVMLISALAGVSTGTGLFKSNVSSLLGNQYPRSSLVRENGFTIFYMGITLGIILGTTLPHLLVEYFGWRSAFVSAAFGMLIAFVVFLLGIKKYNIQNFQIQNPGFKDYLKSFLLLCAVWLSCLIILNYSQLADISFVSIAILSNIWLFLIARKEKGKQRTQTIMIGLLCLISLLFWAFYFQMFLSLTLFLVRVANPIFLGIEFPPPYYVAFESISMLFIGYILIQFKTKHALTIHKIAVRSAYKFLTSVILITLAYALITFIATRFNTNLLISPLLIFPVYFLIAMAELLISPVGIGTITLLACPQKVSTMIGINLISLGLGAYLSGKLSLLTALNPENMTIAQIKAHYAHSFSTLLIILSLCIVMSFFIVKMIGRLLPETS